jgi:glucosamine--fructose-6-phosphate aminotransferase (isomerizing)
VIAEAASDDALRADLDRVPSRWQEADAAATLGRALGETGWARIVVLGGGASRGIAAEWGLKLIETSQVPADSYEPLEFRHGPISVCDSGTLVVGLLGGRGVDEETAVLADARRLGATTWLIGDESPPAASTVDHVSVVGSGLHQMARLPLLVRPAHGLALQLALTRRRDPDAPRHLNQVVALDLT